MKGVSSVIAIILILMIVIALAALAYTWFSGIFASLTSTAGTAVTTTTGAMATQFRIEAAKFSPIGCVQTISNGCLNVTIRNTGTQGFNVGRTVAYVGGAISSILGTSPTGSLTGGITAVLYNISNQTTISCGSTVLTITIETGLSDSRSITC